MEKTPIATRAVLGRNTKPSGKVPSIVLTNPKYAHNIGMVLRLASGYGIRQVWYTGDRARLDIEAKGRVPREERMRSYQDVDLVQYDRPLEQFPGAVPIAVEVRKGAQELYEFQHPENAVYVFGPEDGSLPAHVVGQCHHFVIIPTAHCLNLATAVSTILWDRASKRNAAGLPAEMKPLGPGTRPVDDFDPSTALYDAR